MGLGIGGNVVKWGFGKGRVICGKMAVKMA